MFNLRVLFLVGLFVLILLIVPFATAQPGSYYLLPVPYAFDDYPYTISSSLSSYPLSVDFSGSCSGGSFAWCGASLDLYRDTTMPIYGVVSDFVDYERSDDTDGFLVVGTSSEFVPDAYGVIQLTTEELVPTDPFVPYRWCSTDIPSVNIDHLDCDKVSTRWYDAANGTSPSVQNLRTLYVGTRRGDSDVTMSMTVNLYWLITECPGGTTPDPAGVCLPSPTPTPSGTPVPGTGIDPGATCPISGLGDVPANFLDNYDFSIDPVFSSDKWSTESLNFFYWGDLYPLSAPASLMSFSVEGLGDDTMTVLEQYVGIVRDGQRLAMGMNVRANGCPYPNVDWCGQDFSDTVGRASIALFNTFHEDEYRLNYNDLADNFSQEDGYCTIVGGGLGGYRYQCEYKLFETQNIYGDGATNWARVELQPLRYADVYIDDVYVIPITEGIDPSVDCYAVEEWIDDNLPPTPTPVPTLPPISTIAIPTYGPGATIPAGVGLTPAPTTCINFDPDVAPAVVLTAAAEYANVDIPSVGVCYAPQVIGFDADNPIRAIVQPETMLAVFAPAVGLLVVNWIRKR